MADNPELNGPVGDIMWIVRLLRQEVGAPITEDEVYERQRHTYGYSRLEVARIIGEIEDRGFRWRQHYEGTSDGCIVVGDAQALRAQELHVALKDRSHEKRL